jgi:alanine racemase
VIAEISVDLGALARNAAALARLAAPAKLTAVVKANAYGHGLVPAAQALEANVARLGVYAPEEAIALREAGIRAPIHVFGPVPPAELEAVYAAGAELTLWDTGLYARQVASTARRRDGRFAVHAKIDTGVVRLGLPLADAPAALRTYAATPELALTGVFTHLAAAEELDSPFTQEQLARFLDATRDVAPNVERHAAATAAAMLWPETRLDAVRCGIGLYGIWPSEQTRARMNGDGLALEPVLSWRTRIVALHDIDAGTSVGYGRTWRAQRASRIATIPIGYAEGLPRSAGNAAHALVRGRRAALVGRVCMDMAFVDVTDAPNVETGDAVTLIGPDGDERITAEQLAEACGTIGYEIVARLPAHVPRTYANAPQDPSAASASARSIVPS